MCQHCQKRIANVHFTQIINNKKVEMYLCEQCANERGKFASDIVNINDFFSGLLGFGNSAPYLTSVQQNTVCEKCGMSYEEFQKTGKLGCGNCYIKYGERIKPVLKRLHGSMKHNGKAPKRVSASIDLTKEIERLKELLDKAVKNEEYEKAAEIRDRIKSIEKGGES